jgi:hypothetical protein
MAIQPAQSQQLAAVNLTHQRSSSYSRAMSVPLVASKHDMQEAHGFHANFEDGPLEVNTNNLPASSPIMENPSSPFQSGGKFFNV